MYILISFYLFIIFIFYNNELHNYIVAIKHEKF